MLMLKHSAIDRILTECVFLQSREPSISPEGTDMIVAQTTETEQRIEE